MLASACAATPDPRSPILSVSFADTPTGGSSAERTALLFEEAARRFPVLEDYALYFQARSALLSGRRARAREDGERLLDEIPDSIWTGATRYLLGALARGDGDLESARAWLVGARASLPHGHDTWVRASLVLAEVEHSLGGDPFALDLTREVRHDRPRGLAARRARRLVERIAATRPDLSSAPDFHVVEAELRLREGNAQGAYDEVALALAGEPPAPLRARALWTRAQSERALHQPETAESTCLQLAHQVTDPLAPRALLQAASWRWNADDDAGALELFRELTRRFPSSSQTPEALYAVGRIQQEAGRYAQASETYTELGRRFPTTPTGREGRWRAGWVRYLAGDYRTAAERFGALARATGSSLRIAAEYWEARALERLGDDAGSHARLTHVAERHPTSYYAALAEERLGIAATPSEPPGSVVGTAFPAGIEDAHAERARLLANIGFARFARSELDTIRTEAPTRRRLVEAYAAIGAPGAALKLARDLRPGSPGALRYQLYPLAYWDTVRDQARTRGLDPLLVEALIRQESLFETDAVSPWTRAA
jgi:TolA-binding protein